MSQRSQLEDKYTLVCKNCGYEVIDPDKKPQQKYLQDCPKCVVVVVEISGRNQDFFRTMRLSDFVATSKLPTLQQKHDKLWELSQPTKVGTTGEVDYVVVDNQDDPELTQESWDELTEALKGD